MPLEATGPLDDNSHLAEYLLMFRVLHCKSAKRRQLCGRCCLVQRFCNIEYHVLFRSGQRNEL
jgi:hypothetical protein